MRSLDENVVAAVTEAREKVNAGAARDEGILKGRRQVSAEPELGKIARRTHRKEMKSPSLTKVIVRFESSLQAGKR